MAADVTPKRLLLAELNKLLGKLLLRDDGCISISGESGRETAGRLELLQEILRIYQQLTSFEREKSDLEAALAIASSHHELVQEEVLLASKRLLDRLALMEKQQASLETSLSVVVEHGDLIESELIDNLNQVANKLSGLEAERASLRQENQDLHVILETVTDATDSFQQELIKARRTLEREVTKRTQELAERNRLLQDEVLERQKAESELSLSACVFQASHEGILITDAQCQIIKVNKAFTDMTGYCDDDVVGKTPKLLRSERHEQLFYQNMWEALNTVGYWSGEIWNRRKNSQIFPCWVSISVVFGDDQQPSHYLGIYADSTHQKISERRINYLSHYDALTGLPNRILFTERLEQAIRRAQREQHWVTLLLFDLDDFKDINEAFGHPQGDRVLQTVAGCLVECGGNESDDLSRLGGDEFGILLEDLDSLEDALEKAAEVATKLLRRLHQPFIIDGHEIILNASIGITLFPQDGGTATELLRNADNALYQAKKARNSYCFYTQAANAEVHRRLMLQSALGRALERDELFLHYQPQVELASGRVAGVEALLRWKHPEKGVISPAEFIPVAESSGLIIPIGEWALRTACRQQCEWQAQGLPPIRMAVNLSVKQFVHAGLVDTVKSILDEVGLQPHWLELEITESLAMQNVDLSIKTLHALKELGVSLAIDDFGTGYSSLSYLQEFTLDELKIDASFIARLETENGTKLVESIINMTHTLNMQAVAEGVETLEQWDILKSQNCDFVQGFWFAKPLPADQVADLLREKLD